MAQGIVLLAHGSRDPRWCEPMEAVARRIAERAPTCHVRCAYLESAEPDLRTAVAELVGAGVDRLRVLPMFLGAGRHVREDLPLRVAQMRALHPQVRIDLRPAVGEHPLLLDTLAGIALQGDTVTGIAEKMPDPANP